MEHLQICETPSILMQEMQAPTTGVDVVCYQLPSKVSWQHYTPHVVLVSVLLVIMFVTMNVNWTTRTQERELRTERIVKLTAAIRVTPDDSTLYWQLGDAYFDLDDYDQALANYHRYLELVPDNPPQRLLQRMDYCSFLKVGGHMR